MRNHTNKKEIECKKSCARVWDFWTMLRKLHSRLILKEKKKPMSLCKCVKNWLIRANVKSRRELNVKKIANTIGMKSIECHKRDHCERVSYRLNCAKKIVCWSPQSSNCWAQDDQILSKVMIFPKTIPKLNPTKKVSQKAYMPYMRSKTLREK